jgi:hypothetical protein
LHCDRTVAGAEWLELTRESDLGIVSDDFLSLKVGLRCFQHLSWWTFKDISEKSDKAARVLSSEYNMRILNDIVEESCELKRKGQSRFQKARFNENYR